MINIKSNYLCLIGMNTCNHLTEYKKELRLLKKCYLQNVLRNHIYFIYLYKDDLAFKNQQWLICHKTQQNQTSYI